jgi:excisionase family DNA binding protein
MGGHTNRRISTPSGESDRLLDVREAAILLGLKPSTLYQWAYERKIPTVKLGRALRFRLSTIRQLIEQSERAPIQSRKLSNCSGRTNLAQVMGTKLAWPQAARLAIRPASLAN